MPEWVCSAICGGLNIDDVASGSANIETPQDFQESSSGLFRTEEEYHIDMGRKGKDKRLERPPSPHTGNYKKYNGE